MNRGQLVQSILTLSFSPIPSLLVLPQLHIKVLRPWLLQVELPEYSLD